MSEKVASEDWQSRLTNQCLDEIRRLAAERPLQRCAQRFMFLRHGETEGNAWRVYQPPDIPLNQRGLGQAKRGAEFLHGHTVERILASDMLRAWQAAQAEAESKRAIEPALQAFATQALKAAATGPFIALG